MSKQERKNAAKAITDSAQKIWLAGLGAFSKAQAEGSRVFDQLIKEGAALEQKTRKYTKDSFDEVRGRIEAVTDRLRKSGEASMERMQSLIDERIAKAVQRMSVPTREDLDRLVEQITALNRNVANAAVSTIKSATKSTTETTGKPAASPEKARRTTRKSGAAPGRKATAKPAKKAAAKKPAAKKTAAKSPARRRR
jgi:poly(hydroxyalkanoate) granule-associated protein